MLTKDSLCISFPFRNQVTKFEECTHDYLYFFQYSDPLVWKIKFKKYLEIIKKTLTILLVKADYYYFFSGKK